MGQIHLLARRAEKGRKRLLEIAVEKKMKEEKMMKKEMMKILMKEAPSSNMGKMDGHI